MKVKKCLRCGKEYPLTKEYWHVDRSRKDGFYIYCKKCRNEMNIRYSRKREESGMKSKKEYAMYKGEEIITMGTAKEIADELGIAVSTVLYYSSPSHKNRLAKRNGDNARVAVCLD